MKGAMTPITDLTEQDIQTMYTLMQTYYEHTDEAVFRRDLAEKDYALTLRDGGELVGFSTQRVLTVEVEGKPVSGVFSGDTIIRQDHWGEQELFRIWSQFWFPYAKDYDEFWWFLICKGYKTYRILPTFWETFYPTFRHETPAHEQAVMDAYARALYPDEYDAASGVIVYRHEKDRLRPGVADADEHRLKNKDIAYFCERNPGWQQGNDLVCLARMDVAAMKRRSPAILGIEGL
ncbi:MAG: hypothetical protein J5851_09670 [Oscillospiraceae bacterium]|nr:hypothetical protein [Oscillospiraceae bacterium]